MMSRSRYTAAHRFAITLIGVVGMTTIAAPAFAWNTTSCSSANPSGGACTCVSNDVQTYGNYSPIGCDTQFEPGESIGTWQSVNSAPTGTHTWTFDYGYKATEAGGWQSQFDVNQTVFNIGAAYAFFNVWDDKFASHPGGYYRVQVYFDGSPVANGYKEFAVCGSDYRKACSSGDVYWVDACGRTRSKAQECGSNACSGSSCACSQTASTACYAGDVWYLDCNDLATSKKTECGGGTCSGGTCQCSQNASTTCYAGDVWYADCNGNTTSKQQDCGGGTCSGGTCQCSQTASTGCSGGDVWNLDCNGTPTSKKTECGGGTCSGGTCQCSQTASTGCSGGDAWNLDCNGAPTSIKADCGGGSCSNGACQCSLAASTACNAGDVWNLDCNGTPTSKKTECGGGACANGACSCDPQASVACYTGDAWWLDCDGAPTTIKADCGGGSCSNGSCQCSQTASVACNTGDVWNLDCNGAPTSKQTECGGGTCANGACSCDPHASVACHDGDAWWFDCNGAPTSAKADCGGGSCSNGSCQCSQTASTACNAGDVWNLDCNGTPTTKLTECGGGTCANGACSCDPHAGTVCHLGDVWWTDCDGNASALKADCGTGTCSGSTCQAAPPTGEFDPTCIISDELFRDAGAMDVAAVQAFLETRGGRLAEQNLASTFAFSYPGTVDYATVLQNGKLGRESSPAEIIALSTSFEGIHVNPRALIVTLQKEQSLVDSYAHATQSALDWATGYAVFEGSGPTPKYKGFFGQVVATAWQYDKDFEALAAGPQPAITIDGQTIVPKNRATAVLYKYTPHVSAANTFWTLWRQYFGSTGTCGSTPVDPPVTAEDPIELHCTHTGPYSVLAWPFADDSWHNVTGSPYHHGDDAYADDWNTTLGGCDTEITQGPMYIHAVASGTIVFVGRIAAGYGRQIVIQLAKDPTYFVRYAHLDDRQELHGPWQVGDKVHIGDVLGAVGDSGTDCSHLHLVLYCAIAPNSAAATRLAQGYSPSSLSGAPSPHATWFRLDQTLGQDVGGAWPGCDALGGPSDGDFLGASGLVRGCTAQDESTALWFLGRDGQDVALDLALTQPASSAPAWGLVELIGEDGATTATATVEQAAGVHRVTATLPSDGRYWVRINPSEAFEVSWRLTSDAVTDPEPDEYDLAPLTPPSSDAVHALDRAADVDIFYLGAVADRLIVRVAPTGGFPAERLDFDLRVVGDDGELGPFDGTWYADDAWQRTIAPTDAELYLVVTGEPGFYQLTVDRPATATAEPDPDRDASDASSTDVVAEPAVAHRSGGCSAATSPMLPWALALAALVLLLRRRRRDA